MNIKDKELLAFTNATNLEWQFGDIVDSYDETKDITTYKKLNTLLTPESFVRKNKKNEFEKYIYIDNSVKENEFNEEQRKQGFQQMRQSAGILMNYLEECGKAIND